MPDWVLAPVVRELTALRGVAIVIAAAVVAEVGDFAHAHESIFCTSVAKSDHRAPIIHLRIIAPFFNLRGYKCSVGTVML